MTTTEIVLTCIGVGILTVALIATYIGALVDTIGGIAQVFGRKK